MERPRKRPKRVLDPRLALALRLGQSARANTGLAGGAILLLAALVLLFAAQAENLGFVTLPSMGANSSLWLVFLTGLTAGGLSCLAVQGGLLATTVAQREQLLLEQAGKAVGHGTSVLLFLGAKLGAYTLLGAALGALGSLISLSASTRGWLQILVGIFMIGVALQMFEVHPIFRYFLLQPPQRVQRFIRKRSKRGDELAPLFLGALTVLIPCGITQAMELLALGSGSPVRGALIMFAFVLGTSPLFYLIGILAARLSSVWQRTSLRVTAVVLIVMALYSMVGGARLLGYRVGFGSAASARAAPAWVSPMPATEESTAPPTQAATAPTATGAVPSAGLLAASNPTEENTASGTSAGRELQDNLERWSAQAEGGNATTVREQSGAAVQEVTIAAVDWGYEPSWVQVRAGIPVRLSIVSDKLYSCSRNLVLPALGVDILLPETGTETVDFTPTAPGQINFTCGMGMYGGVIEVLPPDAALAPASPVAGQNPAPVVGGNTAGSKPPASAGWIALMAPDGPRLQAFVVGADGRGLLQLTA
ncbi:MAG: sulfite exporter TauE/SafE family protein, partial [Ardenticatenaceae bacterium]